MSNEEMKAGRFLKWHLARKRCAAIKAHLNAGGEVWTLTYTRNTKYTKKHVDMFKATRSGLYVQRGKSWDCLDCTPTQFA